MGGTVTRMLTQLSLGLALAVGLSGPALAKADKQAAVAARLAEETGALIYAYDQAAWHSTDKFMAEMRSQMPTTMRGYIIVPERGGRLRAIYYAEEGGILKAVRAYSVAGRRSVRPLPDEAGKPLAETTLRMIAAREAALRYTSDNALQICAKARPNTVVLPPDASGRIVVYILTPQVDNGAIPSGGHYRFEFDNQNQMLGQRKLAGQCDLIKVRRGEFGFTILKHDMDDHPTEIHAFLSRMIPFPLTIVTPKRDVWIATNGKLDYTSRLEPEE